MVKKVLGKFVIIIRFCYFDYFQILHYYLVVQLMITLIIDHFTAITFMAWFTVYTNSPVLIYFITKKKTISNDYYASLFKGLFHRAILMSGTAISDWATTDNPTRYTLQASQQVDCPLAEKDDELATCLRFKRVTELMSIRLQAPLYASPLAPIVDGIVVPNEPYQSMKTYNDLFGR